MLSILIMMTMIFIITMTIMLISSIMSKKIITDREKMSPFECGFDPKNSSRLPFSLQFFLIAILFLIFDVEITLILPIILITDISNFMIWYISILIFIIILLMGLFHEWNQGALEWSI